MPHPNGDAFADHDLDLGDFHHHGLIYDWNRVGTPERAGTPVTVDDETLRDGLQNPQTPNPGFEAKVAILRQMVKLGIQTADLGLPGSGPQAREDCRRLIRVIVEENLPITPRCAARTLIPDIQPIAELQQELGVRIWCDAFIGSSPIRQLVERWDEARLERTVREALEFTEREGIPTMFVTEDSTRSTPDHLRTLYITAMECGAQRLCLADTVGFATPEGVRSIVRWLRGLVRQAGMEKYVKLDWHGHRDRGMAIPNAIAAIQEGIDQVHATGLGIGERCGNTPMEILLANMKLMGLWDHDLSHLGEYSRLVSEATGVPIPRGHPVTGADVFTTATGVHAAALYKAFQTGHHDLADRIYSAIPATMVGAEQKILVGYQGGMAAARWAVRHNGGDPEDDTLCRYILDRAKAEGRILSNQEVRDICAWYYA